MSFLEAGAHPGGGVRQRLTPEYLAKQLPLFQERVPRVTQEPLKYPTDAPPNLPLPPVLPGERILLKQHRVACLEAFSEPAVGSLYVTNFRLIFNGNSLSDPESRETLQEGMPSRKDHTFSLDSGRLIRLKSTRPSPNFTSFLTNPEQGTSSSPKWRLNSLRRANRSTSENILSSTQIKKSASLHRSTLRETEEESTDAATADNSGGRGGGGVGSVLGEIGAVLHRGAHSLHIPGKRRGMVQTDSSTVQWDSVSSVSSVSELSECPTTGTDEMSERDNISPIPPSAAHETPMFSVGEISTVGVALPNGRAPSETPPTSLDSGVVTDQLSGSWAAGSSLGQNGYGARGPRNGNGTPEEVDFEKYSAAILAPILTSESQRRDLESSIDPALFLDPKLERERQERTRRSWFHRPVSPAPLDHPCRGKKGAGEGAESASDSAASDGAVEDEEDGNDEREMSRTLTQDSSFPVFPGDDTAPVGYSKVEIVAPDNLSPPSTSRLTSDPSARPVSPVYSTPVKVSGHGGKSLKKLKEKEKNGDKAMLPGDCRENAASSVLARKPLPPTPPLKKTALQHAATCLALSPINTAEVGGVSTELGGACDDVRSEECVGEGGERGGDQGYANFAVLQQLPNEGKKNRRSLSIPSPLKKPMPLPRKAETLNRLDDNGRDLGQSLPANFKPAPPPRKPTLVPSSSPKTPPSPRSVTSRPPVSPKPSLTLSRATTMGSSRTSPLTPPTSRTLPRTPPRGLTPPRTPPTSRTLPRTPPKTPPRTSPHPSPPVADEKNKMENTLEAKLKQSSEENNSEPCQVGGISREASPVAPPRRKRRDKSTPTHNPVSPQRGSPTKTIGAASSDAGSSDIHDTSSESSLSHSHNHKFLPSPSPVPRSPSPPLDWHDDDSTHCDSTQDSSMVAQRHSIPSLPPPSPMDLSGPGYVGEKGGLTVVSPYPTLSASPANQQPTSTRYSFCCALTLLSIHSVKKIPTIFLREEAIRLPEGIVVQTRNFRSMKLYIHPRNRYDADSLKELLEKKILVEIPPQQHFAFLYCAAIRHPNPNFLQNTSLPNFFKLHDEYERLQLINSPIWHVSSILKSNPEVSPSYPRQVIVPRCIPDLDLLRGAKLYCHGRFPTLAWCRQDSCAFLLRAAPTLSHRGQSGNVDMRLDEAILQAVCVSTEQAQGSNKLYIFTEKPESTPAALSDPMHTSLTAAQKRAYYYHNCQFEYSVSPPTFKNVRHSFRKLSALLEENKVGEDEFLIALDDTQWVYRIQELLQTAASVVAKIEAEKASVLLSYESGWDRTTQISSLAQLLLDPYYRTMDGFQVLVQKEWLWFGHPFHSRHTRHSRAKEDGPVFLQWVDCVWQVMHQCPSAFEFNEKFLMVLVESSYSGQFGTFLLNSELERHKTLLDEAHKHKSVATHTLSFWTWVAMVNAAGKPFFNHLYDPHTYPWVIYPNCTVPCLKLWTRHYSQSKHQEHLEHSPNTTPLQQQLDKLLIEYQKLSSKTEVSVSSAATQPRSVALPSKPSGEGSRKSVNLEKERERVRLTGHSARSKSPLYQNIEQYLSSQGIDSSVCKHAVIVGNTCQGILVKLGGVRKHWQERWFVLDFASHLLTYFENKEEFSARDRGTPKGVIELTNMTRVWQNDRKKDHLMRHIFTVETRNRTYLFRAPSLLTMQFWIAVLNMPRSVLTSEML